MPESPDVDATVHKIETLLEELGETDPHYREKTEGVVSLLMQLYGAGLGRAIEIAGSEITARFSEDKLLGSLLLLHGLHPVNATTRVTEALQRFEQRVDGLRLHLDGVEQDLARIRVQWTGGAAPSNLAAAIERAIAGSAPDIARVEIEGLPQPPTALVQIDALPVNMPAVSR